MIYVSGVFGSGTSMVSRYLHHLGVDMMGGKGLGEYNEDLDFQYVARQIIIENGVDRLSPQRVTPIMYTFFSDSLKRFKKILQNKQEPWGE